MNYHPALLQALPAATMTSGIIVSVVMAMERYLAQTVGVLVRFLRPRCPVGEEHVAFVMAQAP